MGRKTEQREAVRRALVEANRPLSAQEVLDESRQHVARLGIATVYRTLRLLTGEKRLVRVTLPGEPHRYEVAGKEHHHHFHCRTCNRVFEVPECASDVRRMTPAGFELDGHDVVLYGKCDECAAASGSRGT